MKSNQFKLVKKLDVTVPNRYWWQWGILSGLNKVLFKMKGWTVLMKDGITDWNYRRVTNKLRPGERYEVSVYSYQGDTTPEDCLQFLKNEKAVLVGAQGLALLMEVVPDEFETEGEAGKHYLSFDEKENLQRAPHKGNLWNFDPQYLVPRISANTYGVWFDCHGWDEHWNGRPEYDFILCFHRKTHA